MNERVKQYLESFDKKASQRGVTLNEICAMSRLVEQLREIGLIDESEHSAWKKGLDELPQQQIDQLRLPARAMNGLKRAGIQTNYQLRDAIFSGGLLKVRNIGRGMAVDIVTGAIRNGIIRKEELDEIHKDMQWEHVISEVKSSC